MRPKQVIRLLVNRTNLLVATVFSFFVMYGLPSLVLPVGRDQGIFMYIGKRLARGESLYRDIWDVKSPLLYYTYSCMGKIFGFTSFGVRVGDLLIIGISTYLLFKIGAKFFSNAVGVLGAILFLVSYYSHDYRVLANSEALLIPYLLIACYTSLRSKEKDSARFLILCGIAMGAAVAIKSTAIFLILPIALFVLLVDAEDRTTKQRRMLRLLIGGALPIFIYVLVLIVNGSMSDWYELNAVYLPKYAALSHAAGPWISAKIFIQFLGGLPVQYPIFGFGSIVAMFYLVSQLKYTNRVRYNLVLIFIITIGGVLSVGVQGQYVTYHNLIFIPFLSLLSAYGIIKVLKDSKRRVVRFIIVLFLVLSVFKMSQRLPNRWNDLIGVAQGSIDKREFTNRLSSNSYDLTAVIDVSEYITKNSASGDKLLVWTFEPEIYFLTDLDHSSRFLYNTIFIDNSMDSSWREELVESISLAPPKFIIVGIDDGRKSLTGKDYSSITDLNNFEELRKIIDSEYKTDTIIYNFMIKVKINDIRSRNQRI